MLTSSRLLRGSCLQEFTNRSCKPHVCSAALLATAAVAGFIGPAGASTWTGGGAAGSATSWGVAANWSGNAVPPADDTVMVGNGFGSGRTIDVAGALPIRSLMLLSTQTITLSSSNPAVNRLRLQHL